MTKSAEELRVENEAFRAQLVENNRQIAQIQAPAFAAAHTLVESTEFAAVLSGFRTLKTTLPEGSAALRMAQNMVETMEAAVTVYPLETARIASTVAPAPAQQTQ